MALRSPLVLLPLHRAAQTKRDSSTPYAFGFCNTRTGCATGDSDRTVYDPPVPLTL
jgi:hypothetical protein